MSTPSHDSALVQLSHASVALQKCKTVMETKAVADIAAAMEVYLQRTHAAVEAVNHATEVRLLAERKMGEFLARMKKNKGAAGAAGPGRGKRGSRQEPRLSEPTLASIGVSKKQSAHAQKLAAIPEPEFTARIAVAKATGQPLSAAVIHARAAMPISPAAQAAMDEAERDSVKLWRLKQDWKKTGKKDRATFLTWAASH